MRLYQESRAFTVSKSTFNTSTCSYVVKYSGQNVNTPRTARIDSWKLENV